MGYTKTGFALQYASGKLAGIDRNSGGYHYEASDIREVWITSKEELERYVTSFDALTIVPITVTVKVG